MKVNFIKTDLMNGINMVIKGVSSNTTMPILDCILLDASADTVRLTGNDMELAIETSVPAVITESGKTAIDAKLFSEIVRKLPDEEVYISSGDGDTVNIKSGKASFTVPSRDGEDFLAMPVMEKKDYICLSEFTLKEMIRQTIFSAAANENNKLMTGELFEVKDGMLRIAALDGHRIAVRKEVLRDNYSDKKVVVPGKTLNEIQRIIPGDREKDVYVFFAKNHILFEFGDTMVLSRLIEGEYFNIERMISGDYETKVTLNKKDFTDIIDRSILLIRESDKKPLVMDVREKEMKLSLTSMMGSMKDEIEIDKKGNDLMIAFNPRFLLDCMRVIDDEEIKLFMTDHRSPCFIRDEEQRYIYLILPVNLNV